jgi:hypothetical protein
VVVQDWERASDEQPGVQTWWRLRKVAFAPGFCQYLERTVPVEDAASIAQLIHYESTEADKAQGNAA